MLRAWTLNAGSGSATPGELAPRPVCRDGHRREFDPRKPVASELSFRERSERALGGCRRSTAAFPFGILAEAHFGGHPYTARRAVNRWIRAGMMREHKARGPKGGTFKVLTLTSEREPTQARRAARRQSGP